MTPDLRIAHLLSTAWMIYAPFLEARLAVWREGKTAAAQPGPVAAPSPTYQVVNGVGIVDISGVLVFQAGDWPFGDVPERTYGSIRADLARATSDAAVKTTLMRVNSPGGIVEGAFDTADFIRSLRGTKPLIAAVHEVATSGAYLLASMADSVVATQSSSVGSIGVLTQHIDLSKLEETLGVRVTPIFAGARKNDGSPHAPLSDAAYQAIKSRIDQRYDLFVEKVAAARGLSPEQVRATEADVYIGARGIAPGLVDRIEPLDATFARLTKSTTIISMKGASDMSEVERETAAAPAAPAGITPEQLTAAQKAAREEAAAQAREITQMCAIAKAPEKAAEYLTQGLSVEQVRADLQRVQAGKSEGAEITSHVDPTRPSAQTVSPNDSPLVKAARMYGIPGQVR